MEFKGVRGRTLLHGIATFLPRFHRRGAGTGGSNSALYCYSVWMRHLVRARSAGLPRVPAVVAELGPGDSIGIGLAALLSGAERYYGLDVVPFADLGANQRVLEELVECFRSRAPIPASGDFSGIHPRLADYSFPADLIDDAERERALAPERIERIREALGRSSSPESPIRYVVPWSDAGSIEVGSVDFLLSQAVLEHVEDLQATYAAMSRWLHPDGLMSHQIDYRSHGISARWDGYRAAPDWLWSLARGRRAFLLNREPHSTHLGMLAKAGFELLTDEGFCEAEPLPKGQLAARFRELDRADRETSAAFIQARKRRD